MPRTPSELIRELSNDVKVLLDRDRSRQSESERQNAQIEQLTRDLNAALKELAALRQRSDDEVRNRETWANRVWGLFVVLVGAVLSLASGLIVTLARK